MISETENTGGKGKKFRKAPAHVVEERIEHVAELLSRGCNSRTIRLELQKAPHNLEHRQIAEYVARAQSWLLNRAAKITKQEALAESIQFYRGIISAKKGVEVRDKIDARKQLDLIFGLHAPRALAIREIPLPQSSADEMERQTNPGMLNALELVYGHDARNAVIEIESKMLNPAPAADGKKKKKLALI